jgi:hypothetical protein
MIPKPDKDTTKKKNYGSVSFMNKMEKLH